MMEKIFPPRKQDTHKGDYGHALIIAGSPGMTGAAYLAGEAALLSGCGLVTVGIPKSLNPIMEVKLTEVMTRPLPETGEKTLSLKAEHAIIDFALKTDAVALGPGLSGNRETRELIRRLAVRLEKPLVIDADGLNALAGRAEILRRRKNPAVLTPHPGEMARLTGLSVERIQKTRKTTAVEFARRWKVILVLKGFRTVVADPEGKTFVNVTGNPGMATGGTGDVLTGIITGILAQGREPFAAARDGVRVHGRAGDLAVRRTGEASLRATDLLESLPAAFRKS